MMIVYRITNLINGKVYFGATIQNPKRRFSMHKSKKLMPLGFDMNCLGTENFSLEVVKKCNSKDEMYALEKYLISKFKSQNPELGYNLHDGGKHGYRCTQKTIDALRKSNSGNTNIRSLKNRIIKCSNGKSYPSLYHAADDLKLWPQNISHVVKGKLRATGGFSFWEEKL